jgi:cytochrome c-type biogenesis protein CcmF
VSSLLATYAYFQASNKPLDEQKQGLQFARVLFAVHGIAVIGVIVSLFIIIQNHYYEYHYAWSHSSNTLPVHYMISCFWEGQEGSFLLWIFWHVVLGIFMIRSGREWEAPTMSVFMLVQAFLTSMILGVVIPFLNMKIGSSPFILLRDALDAPIFATNPDFVPEDGTGLNPLLQNYWMVIHPPTLFLGFAATLVPFAFVIAGLWKKKYKEWIRPALPWALFAAMVLGVGIMMGAYWAYETLNFGGYWSWDPVENAVYIPWIVLVASYHVMLIAKNPAGLKTAIFLTVATFILILYSTFLTRSGILGDASVHSFTDLGLSGQLLIYLFVFLILSVLLISIRWKSLPKSDSELSAYSGEFWIFMGVTTLCLMGFQVIFVTSYPVYNAIIEAFGGISNIAPPADSAVFYSKYQLWFAVGVALVSGTAQFFWWRRMDRKKLFNALFYPLILTMVLSSIIILSARMSELPYIILLTAGIYIILSNLFVDPQQQVFTVFNIGYILKDHQSCIVE